MLSHVHLGAQVGQCPITGSKRIRGDEGTLPPKHTEDAVSLSSVRLQLRRSRTTGVVGLLDERQKRPAWPSAELLNNARWNPLLIYSS